MIESSVARRYARALFSLATGDSAGVEAIGDQLAAVHAAFASPAGSLLLQPGASRKSQAALVESVAGQLSPLTANFLKLLVQRGRFDGLPQISRAFSALVDRQVGRVRAKVTAPAPLDDADAEQIRAVLAQLTKKQIVLQTAVDGSLLGGLTADVGGVLYDGSVRTQLSRLAQQLKAGA